MQIDTTLRKGIYILRELESVRLCIVQCTMYIGTWIKRNKERGINRKTERKGK